MVSAWIPSCQTYRGWSVPLKGHNTATTNITIARQTSAPEELAAALAALERGGAITPVSLDLNDPTISFETWVGLGEVVARVRRASSWWLGDWYIFGGIAYGENRAAAAEGITGLSPHTLATIVRTCMYVPKTRRVLELPFSVHTEVARLMPEEQVRWLALAMQGDGRNPWTREQLRDAIKMSKGRYSESEPQWTGALEMQRTNEVEEIARLIYQRAIPGHPHCRVERELITRLGSALGMEEA